MTEAIIAYYEGIEVMVIVNNSYRKENGTIIAAIEKTDKKVADGILVPKHVPFDNLAFLNGQKCQAVKLLKNLLIKQKKQKTRRKSKTIKKPAKTY